MCENDRKIMDMLVQDKGQRYIIKVDNDLVSVEDKHNDNDCVHTFDNFGWYFIIDIMKYLGIDCEGV